jgi:hypothetical protein
MFAVCEVGVVVGVVCGVNAVLRGMSRGLCRCELNRIQSGSDTVIGVLHFAIGL